MHNKTQILKQQKKDFILYFTETFMFDGFKIYVSYVI